MYISNTGYKTQVIFHANTQKYKGMNKKNHTVLLAIAKNLKEPKCPPKTYYFGNMKCFT